MSLMHGPHTNGTTFNHHTDDTTGQGTDSTPPTVLPSDATTTPSAWASLARPPVPTTALAPELSEAAFLAKLPAEAVVEYLLFNLRMGYADEPTDFSRLFTTATLGRLAEMQTSDPGVYLGKFLPALRAEYKTLWVPDLDRAVTAMAKAQATQGRALARPTARPTSDATTTPEADAAPVDPDERTSHALRHTRNGSVRPVLLNIVTVLTTDPRWQGVLAYNALTDEPTLRHCPPTLENTGAWSPRPLSEVDTIAITVWLQATYALYVGPKMTLEALLKVAHDTPYHPILDYLHSLTWDGTPRLDTWLATYGHATDTPYTRAVGAKSLVAAVARVKEPGCQVDTIPILEGEQGIGKSTVWQILASAPWFSDSLPDLHSKDAAINLRGKWLTELGELAALQRSEVEAIKRFTSARQDHYRPPYGSSAKTVLRQGVFVGTTNSTDYLKDSTGNRRFWPVALHGLSDTEGLARDRDQLWAEALVRYQAGEPWHMDRAMAAIAKREQAARVEADPWDDVVMAYVAGQPRVTMGQIMTHALALDLIKDQTPGNARRIGAILRRHEWTNSPVWVGTGKAARQVKMWLAPAEDAVEAVFAAAASQHMPCDPLPVTDATLVTDTLEVSAGEREAAETLTNEGETGEPSGTMFPTWVTEPCPDAETTQEDSDPAASGAGVPSWALEPCPDDERAGWTEPVEADTPPAPWVTAEAPVAPGAPLAAPGVELDLHPRPLPLRALSRVVAELAPCFACGSSASRQGASGQRPCTRCHPPRG